MIAGWRERRHDAYRRAQLVSFNFTNALICAIASSARRALDASRLTGQSWAQFQTNPNPVFTPIKALI